MDSRKMSKSEMRALLARASEAGERAFQEAAVEPMLVGTPRDVMGSLMGGDGGGFDTSQPVYHVPDGVCGFAWVIVKPGTSRFARWLKSEGYGKTDRYYGGVYVSLYGLGVPSGSQSLARKEAAAHAIAEVFRQAGIDARAMSRID